jgi:hypothetical protein
MIFAVVLSKKRKMGLDMCQQRDIEPINGIS